MKMAKIETEDLNKLIACTKGFIDHNNFRVAFRYIRLEFSKNDRRVAAISCDGYRLSVEHSVVSDLEEDFVAYIKPNFTLPKGKTANIELDEEQKLCKIHCDGIVLGYEQPDGEFFIDYKKVIPCNKPTLRIGFNGNYLLKALNAAKTSAGGFKSPIVLEFTDNLSPVLFRTGKDDVKMVLPIRVSGEWVPLDFEKKQEEQ